MHSKSKKPLQMLVIWFSLFVSQNLFAADPIGKLLRYRPNYFGYAIDENTENGNLDTYFKFHLSIKYGLIDFGWGVFNFSYSGVYDFYWMTRESSPVISRIQNPGAFFEIDLDTHRVEIGYFHESNGQIRDTLNYSSIEDRYDDYNSVSWNYVHLGGNFYWGNFAFYPSLRFYVGKVEQRTFWDQPEDFGNKIYHFHLGDAIFKYMHRGFWPHHEIKWALCHSFGTKKAFANERLEFTYVFNSPSDKWNIPIMLFVQEGYGRKISTYNRRAWQAGLALEFF